MLATPCTRCFTPLPAEARFCVACGAAAPQPAPYSRVHHAHPGGSAAPAGSAAPGPLPGPPGPPSREPGLQPGAGSEAILAAPGFAPPGAGMAVCLGCGVIAPRERSACAVCELDFPPVRPEVPPLPQRMFWVAVRCEFECRACGHRSPLNHLDMDGSVVCLHCGIDQVFDIGSWNDGLEHAHATGDLAGPDPEGRFAGSAPIADVNPFSDIGVSMTSATEIQTATVIDDRGLRTRTLSVAASPGHPLCPRCRHPLEVADLAAGRIGVACPSCGDRAEYDTPPAAARACRGLCGVIADEHRAGSRDGEVLQSEAGAIAIRCPSCGGGVSVSGTSTIVDCAYCHVSLRIPGGALHRLGHERPRALLWWLLFQGPSPMRRKLEGMAAKHRKRAANARREAGDEPPRARSVERPRQQEGATPLGRALAWGISLAALAVVGLIGFGDHVAAWTRGRALSAATAAGSDASGSRTPDAAPAAAADAPAATTEAADAPAASPPPDRSRFVALAGCECKGAVAGERVPVSLAVQVIDRSAAGVAPPVIDLRYFLDVGERSTLLDVDERDAPPARITARKLGIGIGCDRGVAVVAAGERATAWSLTDGARKWSVALGKPYRSPGDAARTGVSIYCGALKARKGSVRIPVGRSGQVTLSTRSGKRRR